MEVVGKEQSECICYCWSLTVNIDVIFGTHMTIQCLTFNIGINCLLHCIDNFPVVNIYLVLSCSFFFKVVSPTYGIKSRFNFFFSFI